MDIQKIEQSRSSLYPNINDPQFQNKILTKFSKYEIPSKKPKFKELCNPTNFKHQLPQIFVSKFMNPKTNYKSLLLFHKIGAGKTCSAVKIAMEWVSKKKIIFIVPASLIGNLYKEFMSLCTGTQYISASERVKLNKTKIGSREYEDMIEIFKKRINKHYHIYSFHKYVKLVNENKINLNNSLIIIDEVQNIVSEKGSTYNTFLKSFQNSPASTRIVLMSATPIFDKPVELALTINLLKPSDLLPVGSQFNDLFLTKIKGELIIKNTRLLKDLLKGMISFYPGAPSHAFPKKIFKVVKCEMSRFQYESYKTIMNKEAKYDFKGILELSNDFYIGARTMSNICFPNKKIGAKGFSSWTSQKTKIDKICRYSIKMYKVLNKVKNVKGPNIIYSNFRAYGGLHSMEVMLQSNGYKNILIHGPGKKRYGIWSGLEKMKDKEYVRDVYNQSNNADGSKLHILLISPAGKEGLSLFRTATMHIFEPYWNSSRIEQIIGRGIRFCSHKDLPLEKRQVKVYMYIATAPNKKDKTIDQHIYDMMLSKDKLVKQFYKVMESVSIDQKLFANSLKFI